ncbi:class I SAM-dependent methyltransferase family protein [Candidatus Bathyarchaeota archaeon]|nr:class I SAM-dependent methyltransferase family protein [Candidatus Bathyarchaeota archaeon]
MEEVLGTEVGRHQYASFDLIGDIAVLRLPGELEYLGLLLGEALLKANRRISTVLLQKGGVSGTFRLRNLQWILGEKRTETIHKEHGCLFKVDLAKAYFSPRLQHERLRIAHLIKPLENLVNLFSGVGCFSIIAAKHSLLRSAFSIDLNPDAVKLMEENIRLNKVEGRVIPILGDAKDVVEHSLVGIADRVLMPLPELVYEYLDTAIKALKPSGGFLHLYDFVHASRDEDPIKKVMEQASSRLQSLKVKYRILFGRIVRSVGPNWYQVALDVRIMPLDEG